MKHNLFLAVLPDDNTAARMAALGARLQDQLGLTGLRLPPERLHISMYGLGRHLAGDAPPDDVVARIVEAAAAVAIGPFDVLFDHLKGFGGDRRTLVLSGGEKLSKLGELRAEMIRVFGSPPRQAFEPHITLMYADQVIPEVDVEPVSFTVSAFALIDSLQGRGRHIRLGRWPLRG